MNKNQAKQYLDKLIEIQSILENDDDVDENFIDDVNKIMKSISDDISIPETNISLQIGIKKLHENAIIPTYSKDGDAGMDLTITEIIQSNNESITYGFGLAFEIPVGYVGLIFPRSSVRNKNLLLSNSVGVIDSGYRGEVQATFKRTKPINQNIGKVTLVNFADDVEYNVGERAAQIIILPYPKISFIEKNELSETIRGTGGYGSTGA